ncbi:acetyl/propionyl/methylcrotonyl-CoA carboxylase subunit alpha [Alteromonas sediminis]|uniref:Biotin carboxylase n=1 Tax=Alteromonas sediminis TaxID=2259342 RepID=A0A3N5Y1X6_9ALTE|nr:acetyl/propionyl/methylcrotonyl-CoA carboxylase subunit alpha [Alteromonas sediminis]RPJ67270.1 acetyl/propionyl/methylcrotonyl-CoA carboxylase subunit alpha [Alteromonas sediminis]
MIKKILIANRGEIACRVIKTARTLGIATVAVYSEADENALHVNMADEAVYLGKAPAKDSYLKADLILQEAKRLGVDAIHPGYGFLSENAAFADSCEQANIVFIGPPSDAIRAMGSKSAAKRIMEQAGVPLVPGYHGDDQKPDTLKQHAANMGYPVLLKAAAGGGGKGMRQVHSESEFDQALAAAKREAQSAFGDDIMLVEKYLTQPRHVEIQVFCDQQGNGVYLFERDCSVQRRHQKVIEEAPAPGLNDQLRTHMGEAALKAAQAINYVGAGTVEFLLDIDGSFYFMEMNTRLQVEHPVTEMITGEDLVAWQIKVANGQPLPKQQSELTLNGHAFEARIYAEDADNDFLPATGRLTLLRPPEETQNVRVDTGVVEGDEVSVYYDPMIAKLIVWDTDRQRALLRLQRALRQYHIDGVITNINFLYNLACSQPFVNADLSTTFIEKHNDLLFDGDATLEGNTIPLMALGVLLQDSMETPIFDQDMTSPWALHTSWRANSVHTQLMTLKTPQQELDIRIGQPSPLQPSSWLVEHNARQWLVSGSLQGNELSANIDGHLIRASFAHNENDYKLFKPDQALSFQKVVPDYGDSDNGSQGESFVAPMNGTVVTLLVETGQSVKKGDGLIVIEAMKMEQTLNAPCDGMVTEFFFAPGELVEGGSTLLAFEGNHD